MNSEEQLSTCSRPKSIHNTVKHKKRKLDYGDYWIPVHKLVIHKFIVFRIPFVDDFIEIIDSDGVVHGGEDILAIADLEINMHTHYTRFNSHGKYVYILSKYLIFRNYVINITSISDNTYNTYNGNYTKPIDIATFESANTLTCFEPLHYQQQSNHTHHGFSQEKIDSISEKATILRNALDDLIAALHY